MTRHRASAPVVGKAAEAGIGVLVIAVFTTTLCGGVVPDARTAAASAVADRALEHAAAGVEASVPPPREHARVVRRVSVPATIRHRGYTITATNRTLRLRHPTPGVGGTTPLVLPAHVDRVRGDWQPGHRANTTWVVRVCTPGSGGDLVVVLASRRAGDAGTRPGCSA
ncbi:hypothetical protein V9T20_02310 [Halobacterium salinarum]|uniref:DUF7266 family protein n=1 Tax=Halobacterium salinarum TaxID=2242 RepID=UPI0030CF4673